MGFVLSRSPLSDGGRPDWSARSSATDGGRVVVGRAGWGTAAGELSGGTQSAGLSSGYAGPSSVSSVVTQWARLTTSARSWRRAGLLR